jgi:hypothetical protein
VDLDCDALNITIRGDVKIVFWDFDRMSPPDKVRLSHRVPLSALCSAAPRVVPARTPHTMWDVIAWWVGVCAAEQMFHFWINTAYIDSEYLCLHKPYIDGPDKDKHHKEFDADFKIELFLDRVRCC